MDATQTAVSGEATPPPGAIAGSGEAGGAPAPGAEEGAGTASAAAAPAQLSSEGADSAHQESQETSLLDQVSSLPRDQALENLRTGYGALEHDHRELKGKFKPWEAATELGKPEDVISSAQLASGLFTPVTDEAGNIKFDTETGQPQITTRPFVEGLEAKDPRAVDQLFSDLCQQEVEQDGVKDTRARMLLRVLKLDPDKLEAYQAMDVTGATAAPAGGVAEPNDLAEDLKVLPERYHDVFKTLPPSFRDEIMAMESEDARNRVLDRELREYAEGRLREDERRQETARAAERLENDTREYVGQIRSTSYNSILENIRSQWTPSADESLNTVQHALVMAVPVLALDPDLRFAIEPVLNAAGVQLDSEVDTLIDTVERKAAEVKRLESAKSAVLAGKAKDELGRAQEKLQAKLSGVAVAVMELLSGANGERRQAADDKLKGAQTRPLPQGRAAGAAGKAGILPAGVQPGSRAAMQHIFQNTMGQQGE